VIGSPTTLIGRVQDGEMQVAAKIVGAGPLARFESAIDNVLKDRSTK
jgi:hypothetical protein